MSNMMHKVALAAKYRSNGYQNVYIRNIVLKLIPEAN